MLTTFYHQIIKKVVAGFGTLFNDIWFIRYDKNGNEVQRSRVPLNYAPKQKFIIKVKGDDPELIRQFSMTLPIMSFELVNVTYDYSRKGQTTQITAGLTAGNEHSTRYEKIPYKLTFELNIITKNTEDALQLMEQILPYFGPDFTIIFKDFPLDPSTNAVISIGHVSFDEEYTGDFSERKVFVATLLFDVLTNIYGPVAKSKIITKTITDFIGFDNYFVSGTTTSAQGYEMDVYGATGLTLSTVIVGVTGGATAGSFGPTGTYYTDIIEFPSQ